jgi:low affinity Fe/Cu permease
MSHDQAHSRTHPDRPLFSRFARWTERQVGSPAAFSLALGIVVAWAVSGPFFG